MKKLINNRYVNLYLNAAVKHNINYTILNKDAALVRIYKAGKSLELSANVLDLNSQLSSALAANKKKTSVLLKGNSIPVPDFKTFTNKLLAQEYLLEKVKKSEHFVVKPLSGSLTIGITINPATKKQAIEAVDEAFDENSEIIIEKYIPGQHYRITVLDDEVVAITQRVPASIIGESKKTISQLINEKNLIRKLHFLPPITLRKKDVNYLKSKRINTDKNYFKGKKLMLQLGCDYDLGGERIRIDVNFIPDINILMFIKAARTLGLRFAGIDFISPDITTPYNEGSCAINEINSAPDLDVHFRDKYPNDNYAAEKVIAKIFENEIVNQNLLITPTSPTAKYLLHA